MLRKRSGVLLLALILLASIRPLSGQTAGAPPQSNTQASAAMPDPAEIPHSHPHPHGPDLTVDPTLYVVPYAHLDTQWRWDFPTTINEYILKTMRDNFALFEKYPNYVFNFTGSVRYRMMQEY